MSTHASHTPSQVELAQKTSTGTAPAKAAAPKVAKKPTILSKGQSPKSLRLAFKDQTPEKGKSGLRPRGDKGSRFLFQQR